MQLHPLIAAFLFVLLAFIMGTTGHGFISLIMVILAIFMIYVWKA